MKWETYHIVILKNFTYSGNRKAMVMNVLVKKIIRDGSL